MTRVGAAAITWPFVLIFVMVIGISWAFCWPVAWVLGQFERRP